MIRRYPRPRHDPRTARPKTQRRNTHPSRVRSNSIRAGNEAGLVPAAPRRCWRTGSHRAWIDTRDFRSEKAGPFRREKAAARASVGIRSCGIAPNRLAHETITDCQIKMSVSNQILVRQASIDDLDVLVPPFDGYRQFYGKSTIFLLPAAFFWIGLNTINP